MAEEHPIQPEYDIDTAHAPVGLFVLTFWSSALALGLLGFLISTYVAYGGKPIIPNDPWFLDPKHDNRALVDGVIVFLIVLVLSGLLSWVGHMKVKARQSVDGLWKVSWLGVPILSLILACIAMAVNH